MKVEVGIIRRVDSSKGNLKKVNNKVLRIEFVE